ncbi:FTR1 family iron permease [Listeria monocytogenes]
MAQKLLGRVALLVGVLAVVLTIGFSNVIAAEKPNIDKPVKALQQTETAVEAADYDKAKDLFQEDKLWWSQNKQAVKEKSYDLAGQIDRQVAEISLGILNNDKQQTMDGITALNNLLKTYQDGTYTDNEGNTNITLSSYIAKLTATKKLIDEKDWAKAATQIQDLKTEWLAVEGDVVSQSQAAYDNTERDLMLLDAYINDPAKQAKTADVLDGMTDELKPFADVTYTWFDAALIPFREGLEALLIIATLLTYTKRTKTRTAKRWIIGGTAAGLVVSLALGMVVAFWLSALAFGDNNNLINGWAGLIASIMMLYVSYWLHRNSDITRWNNYMEGKSNQALSNGKMISFAFLAFLAILREGLETVIFLIGMVGRMSNFELLIGILAGLGVLLIIAFMMLRYSVHIPVKPFFMISSAIVFYLCFKFMGSGIHSLQLAGVIPTSVEDYLPSIPALSIYPSWYSFLPQVLLVIFGLIILIKQQIKKRADSKKELAQGGKS